ncbi:hypothetical protein GOODEAATRI_018115 [Goodea atripinnis]|uniref:Uncharacterized protein n=1 Tax=Goodea atripinnis TaxID=208336 RepID=A0ABV0PF06_9TELE
MPIRGCQSTPPQGDVPYLSVLRFWLRRTPVASVPPYHRPLTTQNLPVGTPHGGLHMYTSMALPFKIPKKKQSEDSAHIHLQSPLSRLDGYCVESNRCCCLSEHHAGSHSGATSKLCWVWTARTQVELHRPITGHQEAGAANRSRDREERAGLTALVSAGPSSLNKTISVESVDCLAELRAEEHAGRLSSSALQRKADTATNGMVRGLKVLQAADAFLQPERLCLFQKKNSSSSGLEKTSESNRPSSSSAMKTTLSPKKTPSRRQRLDLKEDVMETQRDRWRQFRMRKTRPAVQHRRLKKPRLAPSEPSEFPLDPQVPV